MLAFLVCLALAAPAPLRLADLLREAHEKNPDLRAAAAQARAAGASVSPAGALDDPMLMVQLWNAPVDFSAVPLMVQLSQQVPLGGKRAARRDAAEAQYRAALGSAAARARDIDAAVARAYFDLFMADRTTAVDAEIEGTLRSLLRVAAARVAAGKGNQIDELKAESEILKVESDREIAVARRASANAQLVALLDRAPGERLGPASFPALLAPLPPEAELRERALRGRPELGSAAAMIAGAEAELRLAGAARVPDIGVFVAEMHAFRTPGVADFLFAGLQGNLPIFWGSKTRPRIEAARAQAEALRLAERALRNRIIAEVAEAFAQVRAEERMVELHHKLIPLARQTLESATTSYAAGRVDFLTVLDSERDLQMHELDLSTHLGTYEQRAAELERAVGADLGLAAAAEAGHKEAH